MSNTIAQLRALADRLEASGVELPDARISWYEPETRTREQLAAIVQLMDRPQPQNNCGTHWVEGQICGIETTVFYLAGLLGKTRMEKIVQVEESSDLQSLLVSHV